MIQIVLTFIIGLVIGIIIVGLLALVKIKEIKKEGGRRESEMRSERRMWGGFSDYDEKMAKLKELRKQRILEELKKGGILSVSKVTDLLGISRAMAFQYMKEMQEEGLLGEDGTIKRP